MDSGGPGDEAPGSGGRAAIPRSPRGRRTEEPARPFAARWLEEWARTGSSTRRLLRDGGLTDSPSSSARLAMGEVERLAARDVGPDRASHTSPGRFGTMYADAAQRGASRVQPVLEPRGCRRPRERRRPGRRALEEFRRSLEACAVLGGYGREMQGDDRASRPGPVCARASFQALQVGGRRGRRDHHRASPASCDGTTGPAEERQGADGRLSASGAGAWMMCRAGPDRRSCSTRPRGQSARSKGTHGWRLAEGPRLRHGSEACPLARPAGTSAPPSCSSSGSTTSPSQSSSAIPMVAPWSWPATDIHPRRPRGSGYWPRSASTTP